MRGLAMLSLLVLTACHRETRETRNVPPPFSQSALASTTTVIAGGPGPALPPDPRIARYETSAWHVSEGERLYQQFNCVECHAHGGGGIGPALMDDQWIYGSTSPQIVATLIQGRPNGMPSFRRLLTEQQMWELAAYVRSLSGQLRQDVPSAREDTLANTRSLNLESQEPTRLVTDAGSR